MTCFLKKQHYLPADLKWSNLLTGRMTNDTEKGILPTRMGILGKSTGNTHRAILITSLVKEKDNGKITGRLSFSIHV